MDQRLSQDNYENNETITLKIPISLPYQFHQTGFQKATGTFEYKGEFFNLVKQKIERDTVYAVCIKNISKTALLKKLSNFEKSINNWPIASQKAHDLINAFIKDYAIAKSPSFCSIRGWSFTFAFYHKIPQFFNWNTSPLSPPPKLIV